ncbi:AbrB/MazE/SpoVT family DNA-binding domain-containing protein [Afifella sp. YEN Y35]|uniref:AbrB/MazE/SpoVT family DNA-binding domain-containing protein n=1 Tax=Afifella sp. YEN Y35 TaxID=3388337 RepID=UPI0039E01FE5
MPKSSTTVTTKGQITIPKGIRDRRGIAVGTRFEVSERGEEIVLRRAGPAASEKAEDAEFDAYLERARGSLRTGMSTDAFMKLLRDE